jgi:hypothetical protein
MGPGDNKQQSLTMTALLRPAEMKAELRQKQKGQQKERNI